MEFVWGGNIFQKFLNKSVQKESDFGGKEYFFENLIASLPLTVSWYVPNDIKCIFHKLYKNFSVDFYLDPISTLFTKFEQDQGNIMPNMQVSSVLHSMPHS